MAGARPRPARRGRPRGARSPCAPPTTASTCRGSPARWAAAAIAAPPASRPTWTSRSWSSSCAPSSPVSFERRRGRGRPVRQAGRDHLARRGGPGAPERLGRGVKVGHAGTLDPFATGLLLVLVGRATRVQRFLMALPKRYETVARLGWTSTTGDPEGELAPGRMPPEPLVLPTGVLRQRPPAYTAVKIGGERAYAKARRGEVVEIAEREVDRHALRAALARGRPRGVRDRVLVGHVRALAGRRPRRRLLPRAAPDRDRPVRRRRRRRGADRAARRRARLPARRCASRATTPARPPTAWP